MAKSLDFFELFNDWLNDKERILNRYKPLWLANSTLKGIGQILFCGSPISGLLFLGAFASEWWVTVPYCLAGCAISTLTAFFLRQKAILIGAGLFGYNGALIGLAWPFFWPLSYFSPPLLILATALSTLLTIALMNLMSNSKVNMPIISIPFVVVFLTFLCSAQALGLLPRHSLEYVTPELKTLSLSGITQRFLSTEEWLAFGHQLKRHVILLGIFFTGILVYSRLSALFAFIGGALSFIAAFILMGPEGLYRLELHGFTSVPIAVALGGFFIAFNIPCFFYSLFATCLGIFLWFVIAPLLSTYGIPVLTIIFNLVVLLFIFPLKQPYVATKIPWLFTVSLNHAIRPEDTLRWYRSHKNAARYWKRIR